MAKKLPAPCPCGSGRTLADCCGRFIFDGVIPPNAASLMRSRYTAFALKREDWLRLTWAKETCPSETLIDSSLKWIGLTVKNETHIDATHATVEYIARARAGSTGAFRLHAVSRFEKREGRWFYVDDKERSQS